MTNNTTNRLNECVRYLLDQYEIDWIVNSFDPYYDYACGGHDSNGNDWLDIIDDAADIILDYYLHSNSNSDIYQHFGVDNPNF